MCYLESNPKSFRFPHFCVFAAPNFAFPFSSFASKSFLFCIAVQNPSNSFIYRFYAFRPGWVGSVLSRPSDIQTSRRSDPPDLQTFRLCDVQTLQTFRPFGPADLFRFITLRIPLPQLLCFHNHLRCRGWVANRNQKLEIRNEKVRYRVCYGDKTLDFRSRGCVRG